MADVDRVTAIRRLRQTLLDGASSGGGWPYYAGKRSRIEPTCWALLALSASPDSSPFDLSPHVLFLASCQRRSGLLVEEERMPPNFTSNGLAACTLLNQVDSSRADASGSRPLCERLLAAIIQTKGVSVADAPDPHQDNRLQAWPWIPDTFSWVEPTAWCLLALKQARRRQSLPVAAAKAADERIAEADRLLANRSCESGGWNFGNASLFGQDLRPYVPTSALALIALQDQPADSVVVRGLTFLEAARLKESSAQALSAAALALRIHDRPAADVEERLVADADRAEALGNLHGTAMALYALTAASHGAGALRV